MSADGAAREVVVQCRQVAPVFGDPAANRDLVGAELVAAAADGAHVVVLPELVTSGYVFADRAEAAALAEPVAGESLRLWSRLAARHGLVVVGGFCERGPDGAVFNSAALVDPGGVRAVYRKAHLWDAERLIFRPGDGAPPVVDTVLGRIATMICYDLEFPEWVRLPALAGAELVCAPVNWPAVTRPAGQAPAEVVRVQADAGVNRIYVAACDRAGPERGVQWVGGSAIADPDGWLLAGGDAVAGPRVVTAVCRLDRARDKRVSRFSDVHADRRPELYAALCRGVDAARGLSWSHRAGPDGPPD